MPDLPIKPPNKRVEQLTTKLTKEMWATFNLKEDDNVRNNRIVTFLIKKLAELHYEIEILNDQNGFSEK